MERNNSFTTESYLKLLVITFVFGIFLLVITTLSFRYLMGELDKKTINLESKIQIRNYIIEDLHILKNNSYELATISTNNSSRKLIIEKIENNIKNIYDNLNVLNKGGTASRKIELNTSEETEIIKKINYKKSSDYILLEGIELIPKLNQLKEMVKKLETLLKKQEKNINNQNLKNYINNDKKIKLFYKIIPSFFNRIIENTNRLFYESEKELKLLEKTIEKKKIHYNKIESIFIIVILLIILPLGYFISRRINKNTQNLTFQKTSTRGILDAQKNIIVVSNGKYITDVNQAFLDYFDKYNHFEDIKKEHFCISSVFENIKKKDFLNMKEIKGNWFDEILDNPKKQYKVAIKKDNKLRYFNIFISKKDVDKNKFILIITLNDITNDLEIQNELRNLNDNLEDLVNKKTKELQELNNSLELKVEEEIRKNRNKDKKLIQQSRFSALGEMLENIAHQWKQPLSIISSISSATKLEMELKMTNNEKIKNSFSQIIKYVNSLSQTIEDFRTFFIQEKDKSTFNAIEILQNSITLVQASYKIHFIDIIYEESENKEFFLYGHTNELIQVMLNIFNNAKDVLTLRDKETRIVKVSTKIEENYIYIEICDNAGGINEKIIEKIFDPYFTTKHKFQGTGIALYMSKEIIEKHMSGILNVENKTFTYKEINYEGACFTIQLPKI